MRSTPGLVALFAAPLAGAIVSIWIPQLWGYHAWTYLPKVYIAGIIALTCLVIFFTGRLKYGGAAALALVLGGAALSVAFRDRSHLLGDGQLWLTVLEGTPTHHAHEPLAYVFLWLFVQGSAALGAATTALGGELYSVLCGAVALLLLLALARRVGGDSHLGFAFTLLLASATVQFGAGYIEAYPSLWVVLLLYAVTALDASARRRSPLLPAFLAGLAFAVHGLGALVAPSLIAVFWKRPARTWALGLALAAAAPAVAYGLLPLWLAGEGTGESMWALPDLSWYGHGLGRWLLEQVNRFGLTAPLAPVLLILAWASGGAGALWAGGQVRLLGLIAVPFLLPGLFLDTEGSRGSALDWDTFAAAAPLVNAWALGAWLSAGTHRALRALRWSLAPALALALAFVALQSRPADAVRRVEDLISTMPWSARSKAMAEETLAIYHRGQRDTMSAVSAYRRAWDHTPGNTRLARNAIGLLARRGEHRQAADFYVDLVARGSMDSMSWTRFGISLWEVGAADSARWALEIALREEPDNPLAMRELIRVLLLPPNSQEDTLRARFLANRLRQLQSRR